MKRIGKWIKVCQDCTNVMIKDQNQQGGKNYESNFTSWGPNSREKLKIEVKLHKLESQGPKWKRCKLETV